MTEKVAQSRSNANSVQVLAKAALLLDCLASEREIGAADLANRMNEPRSSVYRLLSSLQQLDLVEPGMRRGTYRLGLKLFTLGSAVVSRFDERQSALPVMEHIHEKTGETVFLCIRRGYEAVCIERIEGRWVQSMALLLGGSLPLHIGAAPRVLLAFEPVEFWNEYIQFHGLEAFTPKSPISGKVLRSALEDILRTGCAISDEDVVPGMAAVGAPIFDHRGTIRAALSMSGPRPSILASNEAASVNLIKEAALEISCSLGFDGVVQEASS